MLAVHLFIFYFSLFFIFLKRSCFCVLLYTKKQTKPLQPNYTGSSETRIVHDVDAQCVVVRRLRDKT